MSRAASVLIGPSTLPVVPMKDFSRITAEKPLLDAWILVGPSVSHNIEKLPIWKVIAMAYLEGLEHGSSLERSKHESATL